VRLNAVKHAILSPAPVVPGLEDAAEWEAHLAGVLQSLAPEGYLETELARRIAGLQWRLRRVERYETERVAAGELADGKADKLVGAVVAVVQELNLLSGEVSPTVNTIRPEPRSERLTIPAEVLERVPRYEAHLHRMLLQTMHELEALQSRRRGEAAPLARLDVTSNT
jgi:hypothetical protein